MDTPPCGGEQGGPRRILLNKWESTGLALEPEEREDLIRLTGSSGTNTTSKQERASVWF